MVTMIGIVRAQPQDAALLKQIAIASKGYWDYPEVLMASWAQTSIITAEMIAADLVYLARIGTVVVGWYRLRLEPVPVTLEDLWVLPEYIGKSVGRSLFQHAVSQAGMYGVVAFELDADPHAVAFYERMGCREVGQSWTGWDRFVPRMRYELK